MSTETIPMSKTHHGHSIKRIRDMLGIKQETLAAELNMTQQAFSKLEQKEQIEDEMLDKIAKILARFHGGPENDERRGNY